MTELRTEDPTLVAVAGDWHGNRPWAVGTIEQIAQAGIRLILHAGDFGFWPGSQGKRYLDVVEEACAEHDVTIWVVPGNHEDYSQINSSPYDDAGRRVFRPHIFALPRGHRWTWYGRTWLALGGAVSIDRADRIEGRTWWPEEEITDAEADAVIAAGHADVMITHDCPSSVVHAFGPTPVRWSADIRRTEVHRDRLQRVVDGVKPGELMHGHLHRPYQRYLTVPWGTIRVTGLDCDGAWHGNWSPLDVTTMRWGHPTEGEETDGSDR